MDKRKEIYQLPLLDISQPAPDNDELINNNQRTAKKAIQILLKIDNKKYADLNAMEKRNLVIAFAHKDKIVYGKAFDIVKLENKCIS